jgi:hypothetical protein
LLGYAGGDYISRISSAKAIDMVRQAKEIASDCDIAVYQPLDDSYLRDFDTNYGATSVARKGMPMH